MLKKQQCYEIDTISLACALGLGRALLGKRKFIFRKEGNSEMDFYRFSLTHLRVSL